MVHLLCCDWGTSSFRLWLVKAENAAIAALEKSDQGIAATFSSLDEKQKADPEERRHFYLRVIQQHIQALEQEENISLDGVPLLLSGMASSSIGMAELPYKSLPFSTDGTDIGAAYFEATTSFAHPVLLISGVRSDTDVMRGEETQLIGSSPGNTAEAEGLYIFPGTHSKHIWVKNGLAYRFETYMTGEFFELLSKESILRVGVERNEELRSPKSLQSFKEGVQAARGTNLLHMAFSVRTNGLFGKRSKKENFHYLSGLLIGAELQSLHPADFPKVYIGADDKLRFRYETALEVLGMQCKIQSFTGQWAEEAVVRGQLKIYRQFIHNT